MATSEGARDFIAGRMKEFHKGAMRTGVGGKPGRRGAVVKSPKQAAAIAYSEARSKGMGVGERSRRMKHSMMGGG